ncbi:MAG TPA: hypothetical protein DG754_01620 [Bacteroidales bacterium]|jgi:hypothetical protein|nr:hypothetical protein [Bacteroidales bacterium]
MRQEEINFFMDLKPFLKPLENEVYTQNEYSIIPMVTHPVRAMVFTPTNAQLIMVNSIGLQILDLCTGQNKVSDIFELLHGKYKGNIEPTSLFLDIIKFIRKANYHGLISPAISI